MLQSMGRDDYYKFRFPYWDWRGEIQRSYGLPSEEIFTFERLGETRNVSRRPVVFGDLYGEDWTAVCHGLPYQICDPNVPTGDVQRCPFIGNPNLCHSSNPVWPSMQEINDLMKFDDYDIPPYNLFAFNALRGTGDFQILEDIDECRRDPYCRCIPGGVQCEGLENGTFVVPITTRAHSTVSIGYIHLLCIQLLVGCAHGFRAGSRQCVSACAVVRGHLEKKNRHKFWRIKIA